jgi:TetR/AcrR family transcriptional regulator, transcriptional repressor for nem operon
MRYKKDHKENTHRRVVEVAAARFRKEGLDGVGVASLMGDAGLTHGGFYSHFVSKEALIEEVIEAGMDDSFARIIEASRDGGIEAFIHFYLRPSHREHPERGCPAAALGPEIARHSKATRSAFTRKLRRMVSHIESLLPNPNAETARAIFATLVGTLQLARTVSDPELSDQLLTAGQAAALSLARSGGLQHEGENGKRLSVVKNA